MRHRRLAALGVAAALAMAVAACGGAATPSPSAAAPSASPSGEASSSPGSAAASPSPAPEASGALPSIALPSFASDKDLEALLPGSYQGITLEKRSIKDAQVLGQSSDLNTAVAALGLDATDLSVALAEDAAGTVDVTFEAIRFAGADSARLLQAFQAAWQASGNLVGSPSLGGKDVIKTKDSSGSGNFSYFYVRNDVVLGVTAKDDASAAAALTVLP